MRFAETGALVVLAAWLTGCASCGGPEPRPVSHPRLDDPVVTALPDPPSPPERTSSPRPARARKVGTNLAQPTYWSGSFPFVDLVHAADGWVSSHGEVWDDRQPLDLDEHGWLRSLRPGQIARVFLLAGDQWHPTGRVTVLYEGRGTIEYMGRVRNLRRAPGRDTFVLEAPDGLYLNVTSVDPADPLRNLRVLAPGGRCADDAHRWCAGDDECAPTRCVPFEENYREQPFHPTFLAELRDFGVLRFMDWAATNRERSVDDGEELPLVRRFADWPTVEDMVWRPAPIDLMVDLANQLGSDPWFNIPHSADADLIARFAERVATRLDPDLGVYVEYSNECWNDIFDQHQFVNAEGCLRYSADPSRECDPDGNGVLCEYAAWDATQERCREYGRRWYATRTVAIGAIWRRLFARAGPERVTRVLAAQTGGASDWWLQSLVLAEVDGRPVHEQVDAVAVAPYFGGQEIRTDDLDVLFQRIDAPRNDAPAGTYELILGPPDAEWGSVYHWIRRDIEALRRALPGSPLRYIAYEGGQHMTSHDEATMTSVVFSVNRDPRMEDVYIQYLDMWREVSGDELFVHFTSPAHWTRWGAWGSKEWQGQPLDRAPKHRALLRFIRGQ